MLEEMSYETAVEIYNEWLVGVAGWFDCEPPQPCEAASEIVYAPGFDDLPWCWALATAQCGDIAIVDPDGTVSPSDRLCDEMGVYHGWQSPFKVVSMGCQHNEYPHRRND